MDQNYDRNSPVGRKSIEAEDRKIALKKKDDREVISVSTDDVPENGVPVQKKNQQKQYNRKVFVKSTASDKMETLESGFPNTERRFTGTVITADAGNSDKDSYDNGSNDSAEPSKEKAAHTSSYRKKLKKSCRAEKLMQSNQNTDGGLFPQTDSDLLENHESSPVSRMIQRKKLKRRCVEEYKAAAKAARVGSETVSGSTELVVYSPTKSLLQRMSGIIPDKNGLVKILIVLLLLIAVFLTQIQSCTTVAASALTAVAATSWPAEDEEITKAEAYYVKLECQLQKKIADQKSKMKTESNVKYSLDPIGHDPKVLISYLCAKYGDFTFSKVKSELDRLFALQYQLEAETAGETKTTTSKVKKGDSLGNVVTTGYCACVKCCGKWAGGKTAAGVYPTGNHTIAVDSENPIVPFGTQIIMNGILYTVEDTGPLAKYGVSFDVFYDSHEAASAHGEKTWEAFYAGGSGEEIEVQVTEKSDVTTLTLTTNDLETICKGRLSDDQEELYEVYQVTCGNRIFFATPVDALWHDNIYSDYGYVFDAEKNTVKETDKMVLSFPSGTEVTAIFDGTVKSASGKKVTIENTGGYSFEFSGLTDLKVSAGQATDKGNLLGVVDDQQELSISCTYKGTELNPYFYMNTGTKTVASPKTSPKESPGSAGEADDIGIPGNASPQAAALIAEARKYLGTPYVWAGYDPSGFDCSGFVSWCLIHSGTANIGHMNCNGLLSYCTPISKSELQPGDLVFFQGTYETTGASHVGIYIGSGEYGTATFIHCGSPCQYGNLNDQWWIDHWYTGGRILNS